jgi:2-amino-4-hydroxy-6-hydroxymethyldihydropteridine diphosphokinase
MAEQVFISLGSNLDRTQAFKEALLALSSEFAGIVFSEVLEGPAIGFEGADFYNAVACFTTHDSPQSIVLALKRLESKLCHHHTEHTLLNRRMDLDLLAFGSHVSQSPPLPRADIENFAFVAWPLAQLAPDWKHPVTHESIHSICARLDRSQLKPVVWHA